MQPLADLQSGRSMGYFSRGLKMIETQTKYGA